MAKKLKKKAASPTAPPHVHAVVLKLLDAKDAAMRARLYGTMHKIEECIKAVGWELAAEREGYVGITDPDSLARAMRHTRTLEARNREAKLAAPVQDGHAVAAAVGNDAPSGTPGDGTAQKGGKGKGSKGSK